VRACETTRNHRAGSSLAPHAAELTAPTWRAEDFILFFTRCKAGLKKGGLIVVRAQLRV